MKDTNSISVVIGANYGDEGKGLAVDYFTRIAKDKEIDCKVARFNGGAQAGHTVNKKDSKIRNSRLEKKEFSHVFSHIGAGAFNDSPTYFSKHFVLNPILLDKEIATLSKKGLRLDTSLILMAHEDCFVTTPFDIIINQEIEQARSGNRHGSCGVGFGETIQRCTADEKFNVFKLSTEEKDLYKAYIFLRNEYFPVRLQQLGLTMSTISESSQNVINSVQVMDNYFTDFLNLKARVTCLSQKEFSSRLKDLQFSNKLAMAPCLVFEGAQGLLLDQVTGAFPHVTRSNTGCHNVLSILEGLNQEIEEVDFVYSTRSYLTRHGAGELQDEQPAPDWFVDETNRPHDFQGVIRYAPFTEASAEAMYNRIAKDFNQDAIKRAGIKKANKCLFITWSDKITDLSLFNVDLYDKVWLAPTKYSSDVKRIK